MLRRTAKPAIWALIAASTLVAGARADDLLNPAAASQRCFGAASRDRLHACRNDRLRTLVVPTPGDAVITPNAPCTLTSGTRLMHVCRFGAMEGEATAAPPPRFALIGDSHASHWRAALDVLATRKGWVGLSNTRSGCSYSAAVKDIGQPQRGECVTWNREVRAWLTANPDVATIFFAEIAGEPVVASGGRDVYETAVAGYEAAWRALPPSVKHIFVIRDTPKVSGRTLACVDRARIRRRDAGSDCAVPRETAVSPDPAAAAAQRMRSPRVRILNFNDFICAGSRCYPVVGGALVYKDPHHLTYVFGHTLGPYVQRAVDALLARWR